MCSYLETQSMSKDRFIEYMFALRGKAYTWEQCSVFQSQQTSFFKLIFEKTLVYLANFSQELLNIKKNHFGHLQDICHLILSVIN